MHEEEMIMADTTCTGDHSQHICELAKQKQFKKITGVADSPGFVCTNCGRVSNAKENLCNPVSFAEIFKDGIYAF